MIVSNGARVQPAPNRTPLMLALFVLAMVVVLTAYAVLTTYTSRQNILAGGTNNVGNLSLTLSQQVQRILFSADLLLAELQVEIEQLGFRDADEFHRHVSTKAMNDRMRQFVVLTSDVDSLNFADAKGRLITSREWPTASVNLSDRNYFKTLRDGASQVISEPIKSKLTGQQIIILGRRIGTRQGEFLGIVYTAISTHRFTKMFADVIQDDLSTQILLYRQDGVLLAGYGGDLEQENYAALSWRAIETETMLTNAKTLRASHSGHPEVLTYNTISGYPARLLVVQDESSILREWQKLTWSIVAFTVAAISMVLVAAGFFLRLSRARMQLADSVLKQERANTELEAANLKLVETQHYARIGQWEMSMSSPGAVWSDELYVILEYDKATLPSYEKFLERVHPEDRDALQKIFSDAVERKKLYVFDHRLMMADGRIKHVIGRGRIAYDQQGQPVRAIGSLQDITSLKQVEDRLRESHSKYQRLIDDIGDQFVIYSHHPQTGVLSYVSSGIQRVMGVSREEAIGKAWHSLADWLPGTAELVARKTAEAIEKKSGNINLDVQFRHSSGEVRTFHITAHAVHDDAGQVIAIDGIAEDITERKRVEEDLNTARIAAETAREMLQLVLDNIPVRVFWKDKDLRYLGCNRLFARDAGYQEPSELLGRDDFEMRWRHEAELYRADDRQVIEQGVPRLGIEEPQTTPDGRKVWLRTSKIPLIEDGRVFGVLGTYENITDRKQAEDELRVAHSAAEAANRAKSAFLANMSHEIRTPMTAILGFTHILLRKQPTPEQRVKLNNIAKAGDHLLSILNDVLDLSKIEAGRMTLSMHEFMPAAMFSNLRSMFSERFAAKNVELQFDVNGVPEMLVGDEMRLSQALINFIGNAVKFTEQGRVVVRARQVDETDDDVLILFEVEDSGIGIEADKLTTIFKAFEQADNSMTRQHGGTGLGLAITRLLAGLMGGEVGVKSTPGVGSTFWLTARMGKAKEDEAAIDETPTMSSQRTADRDYSGKRILLVEDEAMNQTLAMEILGEIPGLAVDLAEDGAMAVEMASGKKYDLILMDVQMPKMSGLEAAGKVRKLDGYAQTPILAMTGNAFAEDRRRSFDAGMDDFISKPFTPTQLVEALERWLEAGG